MSMVDTIAEEYVFIRSIIGHRAAVHRVANAYGLDLKTVKRYLNAAGISCDLAVAA